MAFDHGREAVEVVPEIEGGFARGCADEGLEMTIAWPNRRGQTREPRVRFYRDAVPSLEIEDEGHVVVDRMARADVDVEAFVAAAEAAHEVKVLEPLGVGNDLSCGHVFTKQQPVGLSGTLTLGQWGVAPCPRVEVRPAAPRTRGRARNVMTAESRIARLGLPCASCPASAAHAYHLSNSYSECSVRTASSV